MKKLALLTACSLLIVCGCTQENLPTGNDDEKGSVSNPNRVSLKDALKISNRLLSRLEGKTRSSERIVEDVQHVVFEKTRGSGENDTLFYIVNYADNKGFAVLSADKRLAPVYAISESGSISEKDTTRNPALGAFFKQLRSAGASINDSTPNSTIIDGPGTDYNYGDGPYKYGPIIAPQPTMLTDRILSDMTKVRIDSINIVNYLAVFTCSANRWPEVNNGRVYNWDIINTPITTDLLSSYFNGYNPAPRKADGIGGPTEEDLLALKRQLWKDLTHFTYHMAPAITGMAADFPPSPYADDDEAGTPNSTYVYKTSWVTIFREIMLKLQYKFESSSFALYDFDVKGVKNLIVKHTPVILCAEVSKDPLFSNVWVTDGWWSYGQHLDQNGTVPVAYGDEDTQLFHCVWPGSRKNNGWFKITKQKNDSNPTALEPDEEYSTVKERVNISYLNNRAIKVQ